VDLLRDRCDEPNTRGYPDGVASLIDRFDSLVGEATEAAVAAHHRRRLARIGQSPSYSPPNDGSLWAAGDPAPRDGCSLEVLIDGDQVLPRIAEAIAAARSYVHIAGWHVTPGFGLTRDAHARPLRDLLATVAERCDVRVLLWAGAPVPLFTPKRADVREVRDELVRGTRVRCVLDPHERPMHCHHEKIVIVDGEIAFVGGIDMTSLAGDRFDGAPHRIRGGIGWHDVSTCLRGPAVADVDAHFAARWSFVAGDPIEGCAPPAAAGSTTLQIVRTVPEKVYDFLPRGDFRILEAYVRALRSAQSFIYLENQFLWSPEIVRVLAAKLRDPPSDDFRLVVLLPSHPNDGAEDTRGQLGVLVEADGGDDRFLAATLFARTGDVTGPLYVHAKVAIVDDEWMTVGSANLNEHSLFNDSEMNVVCCDPALARETRLRLWSEHLDQPADGPVAQVVDELWRPNSFDQTGRLRALEGVSRRVAALRGPLQSLVVDG
jgi:phosphatidylserine/phosphatidylglycerophosphate/cardiolipin synthase-like enzyme